MNNEEEALIKRLGKGPERLVSLPVCKQGHVMTVRSQFPLEGLKSKGEQ